MFCIRKLGLHCILYFLSSRFYKVNKIGQRYIPASGAALLVGNYTSCLDWAIIKITSRRPVVVILEYRSTLTWYVSVLLRLLNVNVVHDWKSRSSQHRIRTHLKQKRLVALLTSDKLSEHAHLGVFDLKIQSLAKPNKTPIIPFYLYGLWQGTAGLTFNRITKNYAFKTQVIGIVYGKPVDHSINATQLNARIITLAMHAWKMHVSSLRSIQEQWLKCVKKLNSPFYIADTFIEKKLSPKNTFALILILQKKLKSNFKKHNRVGVLLPPGMGGILAILTTWCAGKTLVSLNYTLGESFILKAIKKSNLKVVITSRAFVKALKKRRLYIKQFLSDCDLVFIDDMLKSVSSIKVFSYITIVKCLPFFILKKYFIRQKTIDSIAAILFSSGSEGEPKGIELSHRNILGNAKQMFSAIGRRRNELILSALPLFHAFGLTVTIVLPLLEGISIVCCVDPTNVMQLSESIYRYQVTLFCGIPSLFRLYVRHNNLDPILFRSLRLVIAGAEKLSPKIRRAFKQKFGIDIYEGYGATEVSPVASVNLPNLLYQNKLYVLNKPGTVGLPLPGSEFCIFDPQKNIPLFYNHFGLILISGVQVMRGYLNDSAKTKQVLMPYEGVIWYNSGDKGKLDNDYFLTIIDRYSRMIKVAGEAISLSAVEAYVEHILPDKSIEVIAVGMPDLRKGECVVLIHSKQLSSEKIQHYLLRSSMPPLMQPSCYVSICEIPKLGSGKKDYLKAKKIVSEMNNSKNKK